MTDHQSLEKGSDDVALKDPADNVRIQALWLRGVAHDQDALPGSTINRGLTLLARACKKGSCQEAKDVDDTHCQLLSTGFDGSGLGSTWGHERTQQDKDVGSERPHRGIRCDRYRGLGKALCRIGRFLREYVPVPGMNFPQA